MLFQCFHHFDLGLGNESPAPSCLRASPRFSMDLLNCPSSESKDVAALPSMPEVFSSTAITSDTPLDNEAIVFIFWSKFSSECPIDVAEFLNSSAAVAMIPLAALRLSTVSSTLTNDCDRLESTFPMEARGEEIS